MGLELAKAAVKVFADHSQLATDFTAIQGETTNHLDRIQTMVAAKMTAISAMGTGVLYKALWGAGAFEQTEIAFRTMIGSIDETKQTLANLTRFAAETPFEMPEIEAAARGLIQFGERGDELMQTLNIIGNAAAGTNTHFGELAGIFNQVRGVGVLLTQDFRQLAQRGVISLQDIANHYNVTTEAASKMLSEGKISFKDLRDILEGLSKSGGRFADLMEKQSKSLKGLWSTLNDAMGLTSRTLGQHLLPDSKDFVTTAIAAVEAVGQWVEENGALASSVIASTTGVTGLAAAYTGLSIAARAAGISMKSALMGLGTGVAIVGVSAAAGAIAAGLKEEGVGAAGLEHEAESRYTKFVRGSNVEDDRIEKLRQLIGKHDLLNSEMAEAESIINGLKQQYGDFGMQVDWAGKQMIGAYEALEKLEQLRLKQKEEYLTASLKETIENQQRLADQMQTAVDEMGAFNQISQTLKVNGLREEFEKEAERAKDLSTQLKAVKEGLGNLASANVELPEVPEAPEVPPEPDNLPTGPSDAEIQAERFFQGLEDVQKKFAEGESFRRSLMTPLDQAEEKVARVKEMLADPLYSFSPQDAEKALQQIQTQFAHPLQLEAKLLDPGRFGFADFGRAIQDAVLQRNDPARGTWEESKQQTALLRSVEAVLNQIRANTAQPQPTTLG